ncbi:MAG: SGNH/GDSL hydrolase family protein [Pseudomonadota bacterium]
MRLLTIATISFTALATAAPASSLSDEFSSFFAIGDSLTDDGKLVQQVPPSFGGRFSNGVTYAEILAQEFGAATFNLALGGATAEDDNEQQPAFEMSADGAALFAAFGTFNNQIDTLTGLVSPLGPLNAVVGDNPLVSVFLGANDLLQDLDEAIGGARAVGVDAANAVGDGIRRLNSLNSEFDNFLVLNLPNLGDTPLFNDPASSVAPLAGLATQETDAFNNELADIANELRGEGLNIIEVDVAGFFQDILSGAVDLGISDLTSQCIPSFSVFDPTNNCSLVGFDSEGFPIFDIELADDILFVDGIHPNRVAQAALADLIEEQLAPVPLPAGLPLLIVGLGAFGLIRRRAHA